MHPSPQYVLQLSLAKTQMNKISTTTRFQANMHFRLRTCSPQSSNVVALYCSELGRHFQMVPVSLQSASNAEVPSSALLLLRFGVLQIDDDDITTPSGG